MDQKKFFSRYLIVPLFLVLFFIFFLPPIDPDLGWQLRCGEKIFKREGLCSVNKFSLLLSDYRWVNHHWLSQLVTFSAFRFFGLKSLSFLNGLVLATALLLFWLSIRNFKLEKTAALFLAVFFSWEVFSLGWRSQLWGIAGFCFLLWLKTKSDANPLFLWTLPIVLLLWTNLHGSFILGLALAGLILLDLFLQKKITGRVFSLILFLCFGATFLNPFGWRIYQEAWRHFAGPIDLGKIIAEWTPLSLPVRWAILLVGSAFLIYFFASFPKTSPEISPFFLLPLAFLSLKARRHLPFFVLYSWFLFFSFPLKKLKDFSQKYAASEIYLVFSLLILPLFLIAPIRLAGTLSWFNASCPPSPLNYPCGAVEFLKNQPKKGNLFNRYEWGGFLIWQLPEYKIFVDGRMPAWPTPEGKSPYSIYLETLQTRPGWEEMLAKYQIDWILISPGTFMDLKLSGKAVDFNWKDDPPTTIYPAPNFKNPYSEKWQKVYRDKVSVIYHKRSSP